MIYANLCLDFDCHPAAMCKSFDLLCSVHQNSSEVYNCFQVLGKQLFDGNHSMKLQVQLVRVADMPVDCSIQCAPCSRANLLSGD